MVGPGPSGIATSVSQRTPVDPTALVISTGDPVLPGARGHVDVSWKSRIDPQVLRASDALRAPKVEPIRESLRAGNDSWQGGRRFPSSVEDRARAAGRCRPPRRLGKSDRAIYGLSSVRPAPEAGMTLALDLAARPVRGVICQRRLIRIRDRGPSQTRRPRTPGRSGFRSSFARHMKPP
jgi:hypothetical protein